MSNATNVGAVNGDVVIPSTKRISYILPPLQKPPRLLRLPTIEENLRSIHGRSGPLVYPAESSQSQQSNVKTNGEQQRRRSRERSAHPRHTLPVSSLALDTSTIVEGNRGGAPTGILYTGGRDGMIGAWELGLKTKRKSQVNKYSLEEDEDEDDEDENMAGSTSLMDDLLVSKKSRKSRIELQYRNEWQIDNEEDHIVDSAKFRQCLGSHTDWINDIALCNDNQTIVSASSDRTVKIWNPHDPKTSLIPQTLGAHKDYVRALAFSPGPNWIASGSFDRTIKIWDLKEMRLDPIVTISEPHLNQSIYDLAVDIRGSILAAATPEKTIQLFDPRNGHQFAQLVGHTDNVRSIIMSKDGSHLLSASSDSTIRLWSLGEQRCLHTFTHHSDSVWSLFSDHDSLDIFYSGDRSGVICKVDWERCNEVSEGECVVVAKEKSKDGEAKFDRGCPQDENSAGIYRIVAADNAYFWTASSNSSVSRWKDIPSRSEREALYPIRARSHNATTSTIAIATSRREIPLNASAGFSPSRPSALRNESSTSMLSGTVPFGDAGSPRVETEIIHSMSLVANGMHSKEQQRQQPGTIYGIPFESLVCLALPDDLYGEAIGLGSISFRNGVDPKTHSSDQMNTMFSTASLISIPAVLKTAAASTNKVDSNCFSPTGVNGLAGSPTKYLNPFNAHIANAQSQHSSHSVDRARPSSTRSASIRFAPLQSRQSYNIDEGQGSFQEDDIDEEDLQASIYDEVYEARQAFEERDSATDAKPLRSKAEDIIVGSHGLIRSSMLNDRRHVLAIDSSGSTILWDIATSQCLGAFDWIQVKQAWRESLGGMSESQNDHLLPGDALDIIKERIQGEAATAMWCTVDTKIGALSVHLDDSRCFDAEVYLDELDIKSEEIAEKYKEDERISLAKLVLRNLFDGFIKQEARLRSVGKAGEDAKLRNDVLAIEKSQDFLFNTKPNLKLELGMQRDGNDDSMTTPGLTIALAVPAKTPAILALATPLTPKSNNSEMPGLQQMLESDRLAGTAPSTATGGEEGNGLSDYFSLQSNTSPSGSRVTTPQAKIPLATPSSPGLMGRLRMSMKRNDTNKKDDKHNARLIGTTSQINKINDESGVAMTNAGSPNSTINKQQLDAIRQIIKKAEPIKLLEEIPHFAFPSQTAIMISESFSDSAQLSVNYRGLVQSTNRDISTLELACPHWLLEYLLGISLAAPATKEKDKLTFLLIPWEPPTYNSQSSSKEAMASSKQTISSSAAAARMEKMPAMPTGNSRLTATRMLRIRKACAYIVDKLDILSEDNIEARSRANSIIASRRGSEVTTLIGGLNSNIASTPKEGVRLHNPFTSDSSNTSSSLANRRPSNQSIPQQEVDIRAHEIVEILCNGSVLPFHCTLAQVQRYYWKSSNVIKLEYRWREP